MERAESLPEWLEAAVATYHTEQLANGGQLLQPTSSVIELSRASSAQPGEREGSGGSRTPDHVAAMRVSALHVVATPDQLALLSSASTYFTSNQKFELWRRFRPRHGERPKRGESARLWWRQLGLAMREEISRRRPRFDWTSLQQRRRERKRYVHLFCEKLRSAPEARASRRPTAKRWYSSSASSPWR